MTNNIIFTDYTEFLSAIYESETENRDRAKALNSICEEITNTIRQGKATASNSILWLASITDHLKTDLLRGAFLSLWRDDSDMQADIVFAKTVTSATSGESAYIVAFYHHLNNEVALYEF